MSSLLHHFIQRQPAGNPALVQHEDGRVLTYGKLSSLIDYFALRLLDIGIQPGDRISTLLVNLPEHIALMYAAFKVGAIFAPLDVRLQPEEVVRDLKKINPTAFFFLGKTPVRDFREVGRAVQEGCPSVGYLVQFSTEEILEGAVSIKEFMKKGKLLWLKLAELFRGQLARIEQQLTPRTPALIIYTTGTTGEPKPATLCHENILVQNEILARGLEMENDSPLRLLNNLPPSHVGAVTEAIMTTFYLGGTLVQLRIFDPKVTLEAIEKHRVNVLGQIPTQFRMLWAVPEYDQFDLSSLQYVLYAGSAVDAPFLERLSKMAPKFGTGIGMTESAGFATFTSPGLSPQEMAGQVGRPFPELAKVTIRSPMNDDHSAGEEVEDGEVGEICYHPPQVFLGYYNLPDETARVVSREGILYTGDLGCFRQTPSGRALFLSGRRKFVIKQKGYNVFPEEVEAHIAKLEGVAEGVVVGIKHKLFDEGIFAFVRPDRGTSLTPKSLQEHCREIASYKRPQHFEIWPAEEPFPLTRVAKVDRLQVKVQAEKVVENLREEGGWDGKNS